HANEPVTYIKTRSTAGLVTLRNHRRRLQCRAPREFPPAFRGTAIARAEGLLPPRTAAEPRRACRIRSADPPCSEDPGFVSTPGLHATVAWRPPRNARSPSTHHWPPPSLPA